MRAEKKVIGDLTLCYCVFPLTVDGKQCYAVASEKEYACLLFDENGNQIDKIWDGPGGTMSAVQLPGHDAAFLATHRMYSPNNCKESDIVLCWKENGQWKVKTIAHLPGVHRFDILTRNGVDYLIACTIKSDYEYKDDWRFPGKVWACELPANLMELPEGEYLPLKAVREGMLRNHGYSRKAGSGIVTSEEGVFRFTPPATPDSEWNIEQLLNEATSDALLLDFDGDGEDELLTLSPFHGDTLKVFKMVDGEFEKVYEMEQKIPFAHAICAAELNNRPFAVIGFRKGDRDLLAVRYTENGYLTEQLDHDVGPANVLSYERDGDTVILSANREINEIACYIIREE